MTAQEAMELAKSIKGQLPSHENGFKVEDNKFWNQGSQRQKIYENILAQIKQEAENGQHNLRIGIDKLDYTVRLRLLSEGYKSEIKVEKYIRRGPDHDPSTGRVDISIFGFITPSTIENVEVEYITWHD